MKTYLEKLIARRKTLQNSYRNDLKEEANRLVQLLKTKGFKFKRIYLYGSVIKNKPLAMWSDIDMAIEGLQDKLFYKVYAFLLKNSDYVIDLKPFEELEELLKEKIIKEGVKIYEER